MIEVGIERNEDIAGEWNEITRHYNYRVVIHTFEPRLHRSP